MWIPFTSLDDDTKEDCLNTFGSLIQISCGTYQPDTILDFLDPTIDKSTKFSKFDEVLIDETNDITLPTFAPTISASYSLQVNLNLNLYNILFYLLNYYCNYCHYYYELGTWLDGSKFL